MTNIRFGYRAADERGEVIEGEIEAPSEQSAIDSLRRRALWATAVWPRSAAASARRSRRAPPGALATTTRAMASLLASGITLDEALGYSSTNAQGDELQAAFGGVRAAVRHGRSLSDAFQSQPVFPLLFAALAATGEATGSLHGALERLAEHLERTDALRERMRSALLYPAMLAVAATIGVSVIMLVVVPRFSVLLEQTGSALPLSTRVLLAVSAAVAVGWKLALVAALAAALGWRQWTARAGNRQRWHQARLQWPVTGVLERDIAAARYTRTLALAVPSGVELLTAMRLARGAVQNLSVNAALEESEVAVGRGDSLASALSGVLPPLAVQLVAAGEASGSLGVLAGRAADSLDAQVQQSLSRAVTLVEPILILVFGGLIGFVALGLLQAIYGINAAGL